ncbi:MULTISPECIES: Crp/Fnr family transcriptional regulator [Asaia]|uniref:Crp/Fnr family transcriptional regulator n=1 Tax=Asaia TaxID=91914 RepID=UPI00255259AC|nr:helix-turn-helix domain-containing protein [Asaia sp. HumB]MDL2170869.1 helix-turn-helix domain-containing protein [Asaia sp. HumB]
MSRLAQYSHRLSVASGKTFIQEGDAATDFFIVTSGYVKLFALMPDGRRQITGFGQAGDFLGLASGETYAFSAEALGTLSLCRFSRTGLGILRREFPDLELRLMEEASRELVQAQRRMLLLGRKTARERLASFLLEQHHLSPTKEIVIHLPMSRTGIADYLGLTIETVSRTLNALQREALITITQVTQITLLNLPALEVLARGG